MERNSYLVIRESQIDIETRGENLRNKEKALGELITEHNERFEKLRKGYIKLGLVGEEHSNILEPMKRVKFQKELELLEKRFELINSNPQTAEEKLISQKEQERFIADSIGLYSNRWNTIIAYKNLWRKERNEFRKMELVLGEEYIALEKIDIESNKSNWIELAEKLFNKHIPLIEEQKKRLLGEEELQDELESILKSREHLYELAVKLFML